MCLRLNLDDEVFTLLLINLYVCYTAFNHISHGKLAISEGFNFNYYLKELAKQATFGHSSSRALLQRYFAPYNSSNPGQLPSQAASVPPLIIPHSLRAMGDPHARRNRA